MRERLLFISRLENGESMAQVCRDFGVSRVTGYKFWNRYNQVGLDGLNDLSRRPYTNPRKTQEIIVDLILQLKQEKPHWGALKIRELLRRRHPGVPVPARSTIDALFNQHDLVKKRRRNRALLKAKPTDLLPGEAANDLWCIDFKGQFRLGDQSYCYPLTITDFHSRFLIGCEALEGVNGGPVFTAFEQVFEQYGLPNRIRSDNGSPFASTSLLGLTVLSVWFLRLGIGLERITPGNPQQNGQHERMHRTLKLEATKPAEANILKQQERLDKFRREFNEERPHQAINLRTPSELYSASLQKYQRVLNDLEYPHHEIVRRVDPEGRIHFDGNGSSRKRFRVGSAFRGEKIGIKMRGDDLWDVDFMHYNLGLYNETNNEFIPLA